MPQPLAQDVHGFTGIVCTLFQLLPLEVFTRFSRTRNLAHPKPHHKDVRLAVPQEIMKYFHNYLAMFVVATGAGVYFAATGQLVDQLSQKQKVRTETVTFAGGCFWSLEAAFRQVKGVTDTVVGYTGGTAVNPTYQAVSSHRVDQLEACRVTFDPAQISYEELVDYFFKIHSPRATDRKGPYIGSPARMVIFFHNSEQEAGARAAREKWRESGESKRSIVTELLAESQFYRAEEYHQRYLEKHGLASCKIQP
jgi:peptide-methionine (S)-S-oxide reductase